MAASREVRISLEWSALSLSARLWWPSSVEPRGMILQATCMKKRLLATGSHDIERKKWSWTHLFTGILLLRELHLAHAPSSDCLAQDPLARLGGNGGSGF